MKPSIKYQHDLQMGIERGIHKVAICYPRLIWPREADLMADAWIKIMDKFDPDRCQFASSAATYAETVTYRMCLDVVRVAQGRAKADRKIAPMLLGLADHDRKEHAERAQMAERVKVAMSSLTPAQRKALMSERRLDGKGRVAKYRAITKVCDVLGVARPKNEKMARKGREARA